LRALGVATKDRSSIAPEVPPIADTVPGYDLKPWWGISGPAGLPKEVVDKIYQASTAVLSDPDTRQKFVTMGLEVLQMPVKDFNDFTVTEVAKWSKIVKDSGARVD
jgi:tripartite-type tricarboxylate transporter receptor subunit TctC